MESHATEITGLILCSSASNFNSIQFMRLQQSAIILYRKVISPLKTYVFEIAKVRKLTIEENKEKYLFKKCKSETTNVQVTQKSTDRFCQSSYCFLLRITYVIHSSYTVIQPYPNTKIFFNMH